MKTLKEFNERWTGPTKDGVYIHTSGAKVILSMPQHIYYAYRANPKGQIRASGKVGQTPPGKIVKSSNGKMTPFASLDKAQKAALK